MLIDGLSQIGKLFVLVRKLIFMRQPKFGADE